MATLTETAALTRNSVKFGISGLIVIFILKIIITNFWGYYQKTHPKPPPPPNTAFGKLPSLKLSTDPLNMQIATISSQFKTETIEGNLGKFPPTFKVYFIPQPVPNLLSIERAKITAAKLGFDEEPQKITEEIYEFKNSKTLNLNLLINIVYGNFSLHYDFKKDQSVLIPSEILNSDQIIDLAKQIISAKKLLNSDDLLQGDIKTTLLDFKGNHFLETTALENAKAAKVDFFPKKIDDTPSVTSKFSDGYISIILSFSQDPQKRILDLQFRSLLPDKTIAATYPLKKVDLAFTELKNHQAYISNLDEAVPELVIRKVFLAYFFAFEPQLYLQPVYVFSGDNNFVAYVSAVDSNWTEAN